MPSERLLSSRVVLSPLPLAGVGTSAAFLSPREPMPKDVILTADGLEKLKLELAHLQGDKRREVALRIKEAREFGDITENSEYDDAKNEQAMLEARIAQVEDRLRSATVIAAEDVTTDEVQVGSIVSVKDEQTGKSQKFTIVGSPEAKPPERLSYESPVGKALLGHKRNDVVEVSLPKGKKISLKITKIDIGL
jgi:transcription elongation factor GreA